MTEDEIVGWHHRLDGHEFEQTPGVGDGQGSLACCSPRGHKESDMPERLNSSIENMRMLCLVMWETGGMAVPCIQGNLPTPSVDLV